jgi:hypothetical protein
VKIAQRFSAGNAMHGDWSPWNGRLKSSEHITPVVFDSIPIKKLDKLFFESALSMMFLLIVDVFDNAG